MISAKPLSQAEGLELQVAAPFSAEDFERVGAALEWLQAPLDD